MGTYSQVMSTGYTDPSIDYELALREAGYTFGAFEETAEPVSPTGTDPVSPTSTGELSPWELGALGKAAAKSRAFLLSIFQNSSQESRHYSYQTARF